MLIAMRRKMFDLDLRRARRAFGAAGGAGAGVAPERSNAIEGWAHV
jgi:hypothetical protein